jgi:hemerythrin-like metal-binding protein
MPVPTDKMRESLPPYIVWREDYSVGSPIIDAQHQGLLALINELYENIRSRQTTELPRLLARLEEYTKVHFATEEKILQQCGYAELPHHQEAHDWMVQKTIRLRISYRSGEGDLSFEMLTFLKSWWLGHIGNIGRQYAPALLKSLKAQGSSSVGDPLYDI